MFVLLIWRVLVPPTMLYFFLFSPFSALLPPIATNTAPVLVAAHELTRIFATTISNLLYSIF